MKPAIYTRTGNELVASLSPDQQKLLEALRKSGIKPPSSVLAAREVSKLSVIDFGEKYYYIPETGKPIQWEEWQKIILKVITSIHNYPTLREFYPTILITGIKKIGKTAITGVIGRHRAESSVSMDEILFFANDETQSRGRAYAGIEKSITLDPLYDKQKRVLVDRDGNVRWRVIEDYLEHVPTGTKVKAVNVDYRGEAGANPSLTIWCVDEETEILTTDGWVTYDKFDLSSKVATRNPQTGAFEWQQPKAVNISQYSGPMHELHTKQMDMSITPNHRLFAKIGKGFQSAKASDRDFTHVEIARKQETAIPDAFSQWIPSNNAEFITIDNRVTGNHAIREPIELSMVDYCEFMGWYLSEGCTHKDQAVIISQKQSSPHYHTIISLIERMGFTPKIWTSSSQHRGTNIVINNSQLARHCKEFGFSHEKYVPREIKESIYLNWFFNAYLHGDGHTPKLFDEARRLQIGTISDKMRDDLQEIGLKLGYWVSCSDYTDPRSPEHDLHTLRFYNGEHGEHEHMIKRDQWSSRHYDGIVWCPSTENGVITVRRNNKVYQTGNTEAWGFDTEKQFLLFQEMTPVLTRERSQRIVESYAGYTGKSKILEAIWNKAVKEEQGGRRLTIEDIPDWPWPDEHDLPLYVNDSAGLFAYVDQGPIARTRMPWTDENHPTLGPTAKQYYIDQANQPGMTPEQFDRLHFNYWVSPTEAFIPIEWWHQCQDSSIPELTPSKEPSSIDISLVPHPDDPDYQIKFAQYINPANWVQMATNSPPCVLSVDASISGDCTALTLVSRHPARYSDVALRLAYKWDPPRGGKIDYERTPNALTGLSLWQQIIDIITKYNVVELAYDEWQLHHLTNQLKALGLVWCRPFSQATARDIADKQLYDLIKLRRIGYNPQSSKIDHQAVEQHLKNASRQQRPKEDTKLHIIKSSEEAKIDLTVSLSMSSAECLRLDL